MPLPRLRLLVLDTETTGFVPKTHRVMEYACALVEDGAVVSEYETLLTLPEGQEVPEAVQVLTRIYPKDLQEKPTFEEIRDTIAAMVTPGTVIVGQNVKFDLGMLRGEGWDLTEHPWIDTAMLASIVFPELASYSLGYASKVLKLHHDPPHRALGDVRATVSFLEQCADRLEALPKADLEVLQDLASRGSEGYKRFFAALEAKGKKRPSWLKPDGTAKRSGESLAVPAPDRGDVVLMEEPVTAAYTASVLAGLQSGEWCAVKNVEAAVDRHGEGGITVLYPPEFVLSKTSAKALLSEPSLTADEMTLAMKIHLYSPDVRSDLPIHGDEYAVFGGKLACLEDGEEYLALLKRAMKEPTVLSHQHLLALGAKNAVPKHIRVIVDDASMLEDTATNASAWTCHIPTLRGAAAGNDLLTKCVDLVELWAERVRSDMDLRYLAPSDLETKETSELKKVLDHVLTEDIPPQAGVILRELGLILDDRNLHGRFAWVEAMRDGSKTIKSVPEDVGVLLQETLYSRVPTTLLIPPKGERFLAPVLPENVNHSVTSLPESSAPFGLSMPVGSSVESIIRNPSGKTVVLLPSKRAIEDIFIRHTEALEADGVTLLCQGFSGGSSRMQAEFRVAEAPAIMVMTPWMYEGVDLEPVSVDRVVLQSLPFDHPSHPVVSRRSQRYRSPFGDYSLPRLQCRLFRLLRTFARHAKKDAVFEVLDDRVRTKAYGKEVAAYLEFLIGTPKKEPKGKGEGQMSLL